MMMSSRRWVLYALIWLMGGQGCGRAPASVAPSPVQQVDSLMLMRHAGHWEDQFPQGDRSYRYRVFVGKTGMVRFEPFGFEGEGARSFTLDPDSVDVLFQAAARLDLEGVPVSLMGRDPWCRFVTTDVHTVLISIYRGEELHQVTDYHGCSEQEDASEQGLISQLRALERNATRLFGLEGRFNAAPFVFVER